MLLNWPTLVAAGFGPDQVRQVAEALEAAGRDGGRVRGGLGRAGGGLVLSVVTQSLRAPLTEDELIREVDQAIAELGAQSVKDMGRVVSAVLAKHKGRADGKRVSDMARSRLSR